MATPLGIKVDDALRQRLNDAATRCNRTVHWIIKQSVLSYLEQIEHGLRPVEQVLSTGVAEIEDVEADALCESATSVQPFLDFAQDLMPQTALRSAITAAYRRPEAECVRWLIDQARVQDEQLAARIKALAHQLVQGLRARGQEGGVEGLIQEFSLSSQEGVALMCLAEALLRIPDRATRNALIRDKISKGDWRAHVGQSPSLFVNAATWGLMLTGKLVATNSETGLSAALGRLIGKGGEGVIRKGVDLAMRLMGEQFVTGETIAQALTNSRKREAQGFRYSFDMLGEAATTASDAQRYYQDYEQAIHAIGNASAKRGIYEGPGISIKLSALHPRYHRAQHERVMSELLPRLQSLAHLARHYDIGLNIDAEEADRLELSLDLLEVLCFDPMLAGWNGIGFVVQAYQKRAPFVLDHLIDLARRSRHRLMVRLVKGAYWDTEIKRAQVDGLEGYPVYTRKIYTDISYLACARKLLAVPEAIYPQFATHNAQTLASIYHLAGENYYAGQYEFQCLHGMGEPLYEQVTGNAAEGRLGRRPCRIYAPVGTHETLLAYLVRRLLENGANTSFVNRIADESVPIDELVDDPVHLAEAIDPLGSPHTHIPLPSQLYLQLDERWPRQNSVGLDLNDEHRLASLAASLLASAECDWRAQPMLAEEAIWDATRAQPVRNPAQNADVVGQVIEASEVEVAAALAVAARTAPLWHNTPVTERAACLRRAADQMEAKMFTLMGLIVREAGKSLSNAIAEVREAVDFLRYYAQQVEHEFSNENHLPLGTVLCISPWNFPLAIFTGQVAAALASGNTVLAKPAEQTPLIAAEAVRLLRAAGLPAGALQLLPGSGETVGAALVADKRVHGVMFTGSTEVARIIASQLAQRLDARGQPIVLIAETGGQNAMVVDSSALAEQVVADVLQSAFDSAGQRCSALRVLCLQEEVAPRMLDMLIGAMQELQVGNPDRLATDVGPVIDAEAQAGLEAHIRSLAERGAKVHRTLLDEGAQRAVAAGTFVAPTLIEIESIADLKREVFGPVLHVLRYRREELDTLIDQINATGYGLTFGVHSRIDETIERLSARIAVGNVYVNRNTVGAVVGVQPFGGEGLSGTGPKAGGPLYMWRLLTQAPAQPALVEAPPPASLELLQSWFEHLGNAAAKARCLRLARGLCAGQQLLLSGPTGERNAYQLTPRGPVLCVAGSATGALAQLTSALASGNTALFLVSDAARAWLAGLPPDVARYLRCIDEAELDTAEFAAVLIEGDSDALCQWSQRIARRDGPIVPVQGLSTAALAAGADYVAARLLTERSISVNTAAAGGNASLMSIG